MKATAACPADAFNAQFRLEIDRAAKSGLRREQGIAAFVFGHVFNNQGVRIEAKHGTFRRGPPMA